MCYNAKNLNPKNYALVAQQVERAAVNRSAIGSNPIWGAMESSHKGIGADC